MGRHWVVAIGLVASVGCRRNFDPRPEHGDGQGSSGDSDAGSSAPMDAPRACIQAHTVACAAAGGTCDGDICTITAGLVGGASCPAMTCKVICGANRCDTNTDLICAPGGVCDFQCAGANSCVQENFVCAGATCELHCAGENSCIQSQVNCNGGTCTERCCGTFACSQSTCSTCGAGTCP